MAPASAWPSAAASSRPTAAASAPPPGMTAEPSSPSRCRCERIRPMAPEPPYDTALIMVDDDEEDVLMLRTAARRSGHAVRILHLPGGLALLDAVAQATL